MVRWCVRKAGGQASCVVLGRVSIVVHVEQRKRVGSARTTWGRNADDEDDASLPSAQLRLRLERRTSSPLHPFQVLLVHYSSNGRRRCARSYFLNELKVLRQNLCRLAVSVRRVDGCRAPIYYGLLRTSLNDS